MQMHQLKFEIYGFHDYWAWTHQRRHSAAFIMNFEQISHIVLVFPLLILSK